MRTPVTYRIPAFLLAAALPSLSADEPLATIECREYLGRNWPTTMVTYCVQDASLKQSPDKDSFGVPPEGSPAWIRIKAGIRPGAVRLVDAAGANVPFQWWRMKTDAEGRLIGARLSFMAGLEKNSNFVYRLMAGTSPVVPAEGVAVLNDAEGLVLDNGVTAVRLPPAGTVTFEKPLSFGTVHQDMVKLYGRQATNGIAPGPIQGIRLSDGRWVGGSYFQAQNPSCAPRVLGYTCAATERGPIFTEARIRYAFDGERYYQMTVRLFPGDPAIRVDEQFDMKRLGATRDWRGYSSNDWQVVVSLSSGGQPDGWKPDVAFWERYSYGNSMQTQKLPEEAGLKELGFDFGSADVGTHRVVYDQPATVIFGVEPWIPWGNFAAYFGLVEGKALPPPTGNTNAPPDPGRLKAIPFLGVVPLHAGSWRADGPINYKQLVGHREDDTAVHWPLEVFPHPNTNLHTGEYDPDMPFTMGRRLWALVAGPLQTFKTLHAFRSYEGYINLDTYKEWMLDWAPAPGAPKVTYPRLFFTPADVKRIAPALDKHPAAGLLKTYLYFQPNETRQKELWQRLTGPYGPFGIYNQTEPDISYYFTLFRQAHFAEEWLAPMDELLSSPTLSPEQRQTLVRRLAAYCYLVSEPDFNPRGSMTHLGNPNMAINRFLALPFAAALIPDHPRAGEWMKVSRDYVAYKISMNTAPGGGWSELFTYYDASAPALLHAANILNTAGCLPETVRVVAEEAGQFPLHFLSPKDPRFGVRLVPSWGHEGHGGFGQWLPTVGLARAKNSDLAKALLWGWDQSGRLAGFHDGNFNARCIAYADLLNDLPAGYVPPAFKSVWVPGIGAVLRAHPGDPDETYLSYRQGYFISHCDDNQGDFILHAKGAPLVDISLFAYPLHQHDPYIAMNLEFGWYSAPRFGSQTNTTDARKGANAGEKAGSWNPSSEIHAYSFGDSVDYLRGHSDNEGRRWTRQILLLKGKRASGPNYLLFRDSADSLSGATNPVGPMWWNVRTVDGKDRVTASGSDIHYTSPYGTRLNVHALQPASIHAETRETKREGSVLSHVDAWRKNGEPVLKPDQSAWIKTQETLSVTSVGPVDADPGVLMALYPQSRDEAAPKYESLADGVARMTTSEGTDTVFVNRRPMTFRQEDMAFTGRGGAVRVYADEVHLVIAEGPGEIRYRGITLRSPKPVTRVFKLAETARTQTVEEPAEKTTIRFQTPRGESQEWAPGVTCTTTKQGFAVTIDSAAPVSLATNGIVFAGRSGGIEVDEKEKTVRLVVLDGDRAGYQEAAVWGGVGPYEVVFRHDRIEGRSEGQGRFLSLMQPVGVDRLASLIMDGRAYSLGTANTVDPAIAGRLQSDSKPATGGTLVMPLMPGAHRFEVKNLVQPAVWRNWQAW